MGICRLQKIISGFMFVMVVAGALVTEAGKMLRGGGAAAAIRGRDIGALYAQARHEGNKELQIVLLTEWEGALMAKIEKVRRDRTLRELNDGETILLQGYARKLAHIAGEIKGLGQDELADIYAGNARNAAVSLSPINIILRKAHL